MKKEKRKEKVNFFATPRTKQRLLELASENETTMTQFLTDYINKAYKEMKDGK